MEETLKEIEKALDVNEDLDPYDQDRLNELNKVDAIKDTLKGDDIYDKRKVIPHLLLKINNIVYFKY